MLGTYTDIVAMTILFVVNGTNFYLIINSFDPYDLLLQLFNMKRLLSKYKKKFHKGERAKRASLVTE